MGEDVPLTPDEMQQLRREFAALEAYRQLLLDGIMRVSRSISEQGAESVAAIESPVSTMREAFWSGHEIGKAEAYGNCAAAVSELHVVAALGVEP